MHIKIESEFVANTQLIWYGENLNFKCNSSSRNSLSQFSFHSQSEWYFWKIVEIRCDAHIVGMCELEAQEFSPKVDRNRKLLSSRVKVRTRSHGVENQKLKNIGETKAWALAFELEIFRNIMVHIRERNTSTLIV